MAASELTTFDPAAEEAREAHNAATEQAMREAGRVVETKAAPPVSYWGMPVLDRCYLPDGVQYVEFAPMTEKDRQQFQNNTQAVLSMNRGSGDSKLPLNPARERKALLQASVKDWHFFGPDGNPVQFKDRAYGWEAWLAGPAQPEFIDELEKAIRKANPWMQSEMALEDLEQQYEELGELIIKKRAEKEGEPFSSDK